MTKVLNCSCPNAAQDSLHGYGRRVHNLTAKDEWRCTSCGKTQGGNKEVKKAAPAKK